MASPICKLGAPIGPRLMHSPGPLRGPSFYAHGAASAFCSSGARPFNRDKDRQDATLLILDCRLLPPNNRLLFTPVPQPICLPCPTAFFICGRWDPATDGTLRKRHGKREPFCGPPSMVSKWLSQYAACNMFSTLYTAQTRTQVKYSTSHRAGSVQCAVHREAYTVSQSTLTVRPVPWAARWGFTTATRSSVKNRRAASEVPSRIIAQSLPRLRLNPHCTSRSKVSAQLCPAVPTAHARYSISLITTDGFWHSTAANQHLDATSNGQR